MVRAAPRQATPDGGEHMARILRVAGVTFEDRQAKLAVLKKAGIREVRLEAEPDNPHDPHAAKVVVIPEGLFPEAMHVGYLPREAAAELAGKLGWARVIRAWIVGENPLGMRLEVEVVEGPKEPQKAEVWVAVAFRLEKMGEVWVMVGQGLRAWTMRSGVQTTRAVPKSILDHPEAESALAAVREALLGEIPVVARMSEGRGLYLQALKDLGEVA